MHSITLLKRGMHVDMHTPASFSSLSLSFPFLSHSTREKMKDGQRERERERKVDYPTNNSGDNCCELSKKSIKARKCSGHNCLVGSFE